MSMVIHRRLQIQIPRVVLRFHNGKILKPLVIRKKLNMKFLADLSFEFFSIASNNNNSGRRRSSSVLVPITGRTRRSLSANPAHDPVRRSRSPLNAKTSRDKDYFEYKGNLFWFQKMSKDLTTHFYVCSKKHSKCKARIHVKDGIVVNDKLNVHNHDANPSAIAAKKLVNQMKARALDTNEVCLT
jgi:hypothetical protein